MAVVAPSGGAEADLLARGCDVLRGFGLEVVPGEHALDRNGYLAGPDAARAADLRRAWLDPTVAAVVCARGGYGAVRVLDRLDWPELAAVKPKVFLGASDVTALHEAFAARLGVATLFGPMPATGLLGGEPPDEQSLQHLRATLFEPESVLTLRAAPGTAAVTLASGRARGVTCGGTLALLAAAIGTPECRPAAGGIVLLEDVAEAPYRIDRMLTQLLRAGWLNGVAAVGLGSWEGCGEVPGEAERVVAERLAPLRVPVLGGLPFGHGRPQLTVPLGVPAVLDADAGTLTLDVPALD